MFRLWLLIFNFVTGLKKAWYWVFLLVSGILIGPAFERELEAGDGNFTITIALAILGLIGLGNLLRMLP